MDKNNRRSYFIRLALLPVKVSVFDPWIERWDLSFFPIWQQQGNEKLSEGQDQLWITSTW